jgi:hypothetical protein
MLHSKNSKETRFLTRGFNTFTGDFKIENIEQDLGRLVGDTKSIMGEMELKNAMRASSCLINYLEV